MAYIGNTAQNQAFTPAVDYFSGNGSTVAFTLSRPVASVAQVQAVIENVPQNPGDAFTVSGNTITFTSAPPSGTSNIYVYYTSPITTVIQPGQGTVSPTSLSTGGPYWNTSGNVGIGTSSPATKLHVSGTGDITSRTQTTNAGVYYELDTPATPSDYKTYWGTTNGVRKWGIGNYGTGNDNVLAFYIGTTERMRIDSSGNLLVGTTTVNGRVSSRAAIDFNPNSTTWATNGASFATSGAYGGGIVLIDGSAGYVVWVEDSGKDYYIRGNSVGSSPTGGVYLNDRASSWSAASDENVKDIIEPITDGLQKVLTLRTVIGKYKDEEEGKRHPFLIAQDVQAVLPEAVSVMNKGSEKECLGLSYTDTIPLLVKAIQEQQAIITDLKARIETLESK